MNKNELIKILELLVTKEVGKQVKNLESILINEIKKNKNSILENKQQLFKNNTIKSKVNPSAEVENKKFARDPLLNSLLKETAVDIIGNNEIIDNDELYDGLLSKNDIKSPMMNNYNYMDSVIEESYEIPAMDKVIDSNINIGSPIAKIQHGMQGRYAQILKKSIEKSKQKAGVI